MPSRFIDDLIDGQEEAGNKKKFSASLLRTFFALTPH
jgi:hypothetical protein